MAKKKAILEGEADAPTSDEEIVSSDPAEEANTSTEEEAEAVKEVSTEEVVEAVAEDMANEAAEEAIEEAVEEIATAEPAVEALDTGDLILCMTLKKLHMHGTIYLPQSDVALTPGQFDELSAKGAVVKAPPA